MATRAQKKANRQNAKKSTGPKTTKGKATSSQNAVTHGLTARRTVIYTESQQKYDFYRQEMIEDLKPIGPMQYRLTDRIVNSLYKTMKELKNLQNHRNLNTEHATRATKKCKTNPISLPRIEVKHRSAAGGPIHQNMQNKPNSHDQMNVTPAISKDYENARPCELPQKTINHPRPKAESITQYDIRNTKQSETEAEAKPRTTRDGWNLTSYNYKEEKSGPICGERREE